MIERLTTPTGDVVTRVDGRLSASRIDPRAEARAFVDDRAALLDQVQTVFILGLGAGYHVAEVAARTAARVVVIEPRADVIAALPLTFDPERIFIEQLDAADRVRASSRVRTGLAQSYLVLVHPASRGSDPDLYREVAALLCARQPAAFSFVWALRDLAPLGEVSGPGPLTIHDLVQAEVIADAGERERALLRALKELVK